MSTLPPSRSLLTKGNASKLPIHWDKDTKKLTAVNGVLNMQTGMPQRGEEAKVQECIDRYMRNDDLKIMFSLTDMSLPTMQRFMAEAVLIVRDDGGFLSQMHVNMKKDAQRAEFLEARARQGLVQGENGEWIVTTPTVSAKVSRVLELNRERWIAMGVLPENWTGDGSNGVEYVGMNDDYIRSLLANYEDWTAEEVHTLLAGHLSNVYRGVQTEWIADGIDRNMVAAKLMGTNYSVLSGHGSLVLGNALSPDEINDYWSRSLKQIVLGNYTDEVTIAGTSGQIVLGFTGADLLGDIRDIVHDLTHWKWTWGHGTQSVSDAIGLLPIVGVIKFQDEVRILVKAGAKPEVIRGVFQRQLDAFMDITELESRAGHVLKKHVGKSDEYLKRRIQKGVDAASTFTDYDTARNITITILQKHNDSIIQWSKNAQDGQRYLLPTYNAGTPIGRHMGKNLLSRDATMVDIEIISDGRGGYNIFRALLR